MTSLLTLNSDVVSAAATSLCTTANNMPDPLSAAAVSSGSPSVDQTITTVINSLSDVLLGAAAEMFRIGQGALDAVDAFAATDRAL